jgi:hypothetical protein
MSLMVQVPFEHIGIADELRARPPVYMSGFGPKCRDARVNFIPRAGPSMERGDGRPRFVVEARPSEHLGTRVLLFVQKLRLGRLIGN